MPSLRESLLAAVDQHRDDEPQEPLQQLATPDIDPSAGTGADPADAGQNSPSVDRPRDQVGRFAPRDAGTQASERTGVADVGGSGAAPQGVAQGAANAAPVTPPTDPRLAAPPSSWKPEKRAKWEGVDPEVREYIHQREEEIARGVEPLKRVWGTLQPYMPLIQQSGRSPEAVVGDVMHTVALLKTSDPQSKFNLWMNIGKAYGVPTQQLAAATGQGDQAQLDPHLAHLTSQVQQLEGTIGDFQQQQMQAVYSQAQQMLSEFSAAHPHLETVRETMGKLISMGEAPDLKTAYDKAIRLHDGLWQQQQAQQRDADQRTQREAADKAAKAARRSAISPKSASPSAPGAGAAPGSRQDTLRAAMAQVVGGRI